MVLKVIMKTLGFNLSKKEADGKLLSDFKFGKYPPFSRVVAGDHW
jgi:hypothetical protein